MKSSHYAVSWAFAQRGLKPATRIVLWALAHYANREGQCWPSRATLADDAEVSVDTLDRHLAYLAEVGLITIQNRTREGTASPTSSLYTLNFDLEMAEKHLARNRKTAGTAQQSQPQFAARSEEGGEPQIAARLAANAISPSDPVCDDKASRNLRPESRTIESNCTPLTPQGGTGRLFSNSSLEPHLEASLQLIASTPLSIVAIKAVEAVLKAQGYTITHFPEVKNPENGKKVGSLSLSAKPPGEGTPIGFELVPDRIGTAVKRLSCFPGRKVLLLRESDLQAAPDGVDALIVRQPIEPPKPEAAPGPAAAKPVANTGVFVEEDTEAWEAWKKTTPVLAVVRGEPQHQGFYATPSPEHRGRKGRYFPSLFPPPASPNRDSSAQSQLV